MTETVQAGASAPAPAGGRRPLPPIEHGTPRGYRQHRARKVPYCDPCRDAIREENRASRERRASASQQSWNRGLLGKAAALPPPRPTGRECPDEACGRPAYLPQQSAHLVVVAVDGSREPARWYCAGACAAYGQALAEVRSIATAGEGDRA